MSETEKAEGAVRVNDRRRFDTDGNPRQPAEDQQPEQQAAAQPPECPAAEGSDAEIARLQAELEAARRRVDELARAIQAGERDREGFKERLTRERERMADVEKGNIARTLLEAVDELDLCLNQADDSALAQGVRLIRDGILQKLAALGVERVQMAGKPYDPNLAEAVDMELTADPEEDQSVVVEIRPAYRLKERIIREGRVKVARYVKPADA
jgi:molecular chaperone GrpE